MQARVTNEKLGGGVQICLDQPASYFVRSEGPVVKNPVLTVKTGKKWNPREVVQHAQGTLQHRDIIGQVQSGRVGFGFGDGGKAWGEAILPERRQMVTRAVTSQGNG